MRPHRVKRLLGLVAGLALAGCADASLEKAEGYLCDFGKFPETTIVGHVKKSGAMVQKEIDPAEVAEYASTVASTLARPITDRFERKYPADCYNKKKDYYYPCNKVVRLDFTKVEAIFRAESFDRADRFAVALCERMTANLLAAVVKGRVQMGVDLSCRPVLRERCRVK